MSEGQACDLFTDDRLFRMRDDKPLYATMALILPELPTQVEIAAALEIVGRVAFASLFVPEDPAHAWFSDQVQPDRVNIVIASSPQRLPKGLPREVAHQLGAKVQGHGFCGEIADAYGVSLYAIVGADEQSLLQTVRALVTDAGGPDSPQTAVARAYSAAQRQGPKMTSSLHEITLVPGLYQVSQDGEHSLCGRIQVASTERAAWQASVRVLALLCQHASALQFPLTDVPGVDRSTEAFKVDVRADQGADTAIHMALSDHSLTVSLSGSYEEAQRLALHAWLAPLPMRESVPWRQRLVDLTGEAPDLAQAVWQNYRDSLYEKPLAEELATPTDETVFVWEDEGEVAQLRTCLAEALQQMTAMAQSEPVAGEAWQMEVFTSASSATARTLEDLAQSLAATSGLAVTVVARPTHKSGVQWLMSDVIPALAGVSGITSVQLSARRFYGAKADSAVDRPIRYLQELYPGDALLAHALHIEEHDVWLSLRDEGPMFLTEVYGDSDELRGTWSFEGWSASRPYLPDCATGRQVEVPVAGVRLKRGRKVAAEWPVATDAERMWTWYSHAVLPVLKEKAVTHADGRKFDRLEIHAWLDAQDVQLIEQEHASVGEALAEDLYFNTLDALRQFGVESGDSAWSRPGTVVPFIHERSGTGPSAKVIVHGLAPTADVRLNSRPSDAAKSLRVTAARWCQTSWQLSLAGDGFAEQERTTLAQWLASPAVCEPLPQVTTAPVDVETALYPDEVAAMMEILPQTCVLEHSYAGLPIWFGECYEQLSGYTTSVHKQALWKPTLFVNARHHANEVSSTPAALMLLQSFLSGARSLERINVAVIPLQNVDGATTHAALCAEHPTWMHHAARYNACGDEFARDYFDPASPYGESRTYGRVFDRWCPDVVLDDHGIPSHEWVQPFAGFGSPPSFPVSYWIPQARMYTIWRRLADADEVRKAYQGNLEAHVASYIQADEAVKSANDRMLARYRRYGHDFDPTYFPLTLTDGALTFAHIVTASLTSRSAIARYPQSVTAEVVTETDDETVTGQELTKRVKAHRLVHEALLDWLTETVQPLELSRIEESGGTVTLRLTRPRPLQPSSREKEV
ncbi:MAG: M14 family metallopeptidase [Firmicutes bacterium]|nr:M14 family metallopeptidase [Bacillota bacterium]